MAEYDLPIPGFGVLNGLEYDGVAEFLNVKFAEVTKRFGFAKLVTPKDAEKTMIDCTRQGPLCPQEQPFNDNYNGVPLEECAPLDIRYSEEECLNLRMQIPIGYSNLPVVVWLHGGSNIAGSPYRGSSRAFSWIRNSIEHDKPFIFVCPHYRVGLFGWLPTEEAYNQAIDDQRLAVEWVRKYGPSFGADVSRITLVGQSAGASDTYAHLLDKRSTKLVSQIALMSGHVGTSGIVSREQYIDLAKRIATEIGCSVEELSTTGADKIVQAQIKLGINVYAPIEIPADMTPTMDEIPRLIVGDCARDGHFFADIPEAVANTPEGISTVDFFTDIIFRKGANELWEKYPRVLRHLCDGVNPYTPSWGNNHMVELHYIVNGYDIKNNDAIYETQKVWAELVNLQDPWDSKKQAFWIPKSGLPKLIDSYEAWEKRKIRAPKVDEKKLNRLVRGW